MGLAQVRLGDGVGVRQLGEEAELVFDACMSLLTLIPSFCWLSASGGLVVEERIVSFSIAHPGLGLRRVSSGLVREKWGGIIVSRRRWSCSLGCGCRKVW